jgi:hypothetical protein
MSVSVAHIDRWHAGDVREVFHATRNRAEAAFEAADGITELPAFGSWGGDASDAARDAIGRTRRDLDAHGNEALAVAQDVRKAADDIELVTSKLAQLRSDADHMGMTVDPVRNAIGPGPGSAGDPPIEIELKRMQLQSELDAILAEAVRVDQELASAIDTATGVAPVPDTPHDNRPEIQDALSRRLPEDALQFNHDAQRIEPVLPRHRRAGRHSVPHQAPGRLGRIRHGTFMIGGRDMTARRDPDAGCVDARKWSGEARIRSSGFSSAFSRECAEQSTCSRR